MLAGHPRCDSECRDPFPNHQGARECCGPGGETCLSNSPPSRKKVGKSSAGGMEGPEQREPCLGGPAWSKQGCWCHPAAAQGTTPPGQAGTERPPAAILTGGADRLALPSPPEEGKMHSGLLAHLIVTAAGWKACSAEPYPRGCGGGRNGNPPLPSTPGLHGEGRVSPLFPHIPYRRGPLYVASDSPRLRRGNPGGLGADPGSADSSTGLASLHPSSDPKPCGQGGGSSCR